MTTVKEKITVPPVKIWQFMHGSWAEQTLRSALELDIFTPLEKGSADSRSVATAVKANPRATEMLLDALTSMGFLTKSGGKYSLTDEARVYLVPSSHLYMGTFLKNNERINADWKELTNTVRTGKPPIEVNTDEKAKEFFPVLAEGIFPLGFSMAQHVAEQLKVKELPAGAKVLDVACGAGTWSIPMAIVNNELKVEGLDFQPILDVAKKTAQRFGVDNRFGYISGNWREVSWKKNEYDIVILGHILHSEGVEYSKELVKRSFEALKPGGTIVIAEMVAQNDRAGSAQVMLFGVNMLMHTTEGCVFTENELFDMLTHAGFAKPQHLQLAHVPDSPIVTAKKPA